MAKYNVFRDKSSELGSVAFFTVMLGVNFIPILFCSIFYWKRAQFVYPILFVMLFLLVIGNFFAARSLIQHVALSFCLAASAVIATVVATDCYTSYISNDGWSYGIGFVATIAATLFVLFLSFVSFAIKDQQLKKRQAADETN